MIHQAEISLPGPSLPPMGTQVKWLFFLRDNNQALPEHTLQTRPSSCCPCVGGSQCPPALTSERFSLSSTQGSRCGSLPLLLPLKHLPHPSCDVGIFSHSSTLTMCQTQNPKCNHWTRRVQSSHFTRRSETQRGEVTCPGSPTSLAHTG